MRRRSFAKYKMPASANSPNDALNTPLPFVSGTGLSISSGNSVLSKPTERECTHRKFGHMPNTFLNRASEPDQLKSTLASAAACPNASTEFPATVFTPASCICSIASCDSAGSARTRMVSVLMGSERRGHYITIEASIVQQAQFRKIKSDVYCTEFDTANRRLLQYTALQ